MRPDTGGAAAAVQKCNLAKYDPGSVCIDTFLVISFGKMNFNTHGTLGQQIQIAAIIPFIKYKLTFAIILPGKLFLYHI